MNQEFEITADPAVVIERRGKDTITYRNIENNQRWMVTGKCDRRGLCMIGAAVGNVIIESVEHLEALCKERGVTRVDSMLDVPVSINFSGCCPLKVKELENGDKIIS